MAIDVSKIGTKQKVNRGELEVLSGKLSFLVTVVKMERKVMRQESYICISQTMEEAINDCEEIANRLLFAGLEEEQ